LQRYKARRHVARPGSRGSVIMSKIVGQRAKAPSRTALFDAARRWDPETVKTMLKAAPELVNAADPRGRMALHLACAVPPGSKGLGEPNGVRTVTALLAAGANLEAAVPMDEDEGASVRRRSGMRSRAAATCRWRAFCSSAGRTRATRCGRSCSRMTRSPAASC
jgi:hypothetical protein